MMPVYRKAKSHTNTVTDALTYYRQFATMHVAKLEEETLMLTENMLHTPYTQQETRGVR